MTDHKYDKINQESKNVWENFLKKHPDSDLRFPDELLIRIFSNRYVKVKRPTAKVLDHGFGMGNNLLFFASEGYECYGCEISEDLINRTKQKFKNIGYEVDLELLTGDFLPYNDNFFDIIVSWNVIHYLGKREKVMKIIKEFHRILKPNGVLILSTLHPENSVFKRSKHIGENSYEVTQESKFDNRKGLTLFATKTKEELIKLFADFSKVKYGFQMFDLFLPEKTMAARLIYATK